MLCIHGNLRISQHALTCFRMLGTTGLTRIIEDMEVIPRSGLALAAPYFYIIFKGTDKQNLRVLISPVLIQLCARSGLLSHSFPLARSNMARANLAPIRFSRAVSEGDACLHHHGCTRRVPQQTQHTHLCAKRHSESASLYH